MFFCRLEVLSHGDFRATSLAMALRLVRIAVMTLGKYQRPITNESIL
jgi:hypothetical protein